MKEFLINLLGARNVLDQPEQMESYREDFTEIDPVDPGLVAFVTTQDQIRAIVKKASETKTPITARVYGTNVGGLTLPSPGGLILDLTRMNNVLEVNEKDMYAVIEPGVTQQIMKDYLIQKGIPLSLGFSLAPPATSIFANALLGGLTNRSLKYGDQSEWISGLEVVLHDGSVVKTGSWALSDVAFGLVPFPDLTGLFVAWQGTTGIATKMAFQLWPQHKLNRRLFILTYGVHGTYEAMRRLCRAEICDDIGGLSWPSSKMLMGVQHPHPTPSVGEPLFFLYVDLTADIQEEMDVKEKILHSIIADLRKEGEEYEDTLDVLELIRVSPALGAFADFPTDLKFLTSHPGKGMSWIGTYGPLSRMEQGVEACSEIMVRHGFPPLIVSRPMRGGHFVVLRLITTFDKKKPEEVARVKAVNREILDAVTKLGYVMYKTPVWAWKHLESKMDPGMLALIKKVKGLMDPDGIFNPGKLGL